MSRKLLKCFRRRDSIFYKLLQQFLPLLFELLKHSPTNAESYIFQLNRH
ncbi:DUF2887 domain-containing protein [Nostoc cycadae]